jgi:molecular chaperone DnaK
MAKVDHALQRCRLQRSDIDLALMIGGTSKIPRVNREMHDRFGAKLKCPENPASIIAEGAAIIDALGLQPVLSRSIAVELSDGSMLPILSAGEVVKPESCEREVTFYCTDNRDGQARLVVKEAAQSTSSDYITKLVLPFPVSSALPKPYNHERVIVRFRIDENLILHVTAKAATQTEPVNAEVYDLCFALKSSS